MPFSKKDADAYDANASSAKLRKEWTGTANRVLNETGDEEEAKKVANKRVDKDYARKSALAELLDLAKSCDCDVFKTTTGPRRAPRFSSAGFSHTRIHKPGFHRTQFRRERNVGRMTSSGKRNYKSIDAEKSNPLGDLESLAKGFGNNMVSFTTTTTRGHERDVLSQQKGSLVKPYKKRRFQKPVQPPAVE